jgi:RNA polymerase sigma-70 factor (ECF subfamily)
MGRVHTDGGPIPSELIAKAQAGDLDAQRRLYALIRPYVRFVVASLTGRVGDLDELCQEACAQILVNLRRFRGTGKFTTWVCAVAAQRVSRWRRRLRRELAARRAFGTTLGDGEVRPPEDSLLRREALAAADEAMLALPERMYLALVMLDILGLHPAEAAKMIGGSARSISTNAYRAKVRVRDHFLSLGLLDAPVVVRTDEPAGEDPAELEGADHVGRS